MSLTLIILLLVAVAAVLAIAELILPTGGVLGVLAGLAGIGALACCFFVDKWLGLGLTVAALVVSPFVAAGMMKVWEKSPVGKAIIVSDVAGKPTDLNVPVGTVGTALSELRPMGEADFAGETMQVLSEFGSVGRGEAVRVVGFDGVVAKVRPLREEAAVNG
ncbi:MAG: NfeD family protein [Planctomycetota bacterium]